MVSSIPSVPGIHLLMLFRNHAWNLEQSRFLRRLLFTKRLLDKLALARTQKMLRQYLSLDWQTQARKLFRRRIIPMHPLDHQPNHPQFHVVADDWQFLSAAGCEVKEHRPEALRLDVGSGRNLDR